MNAADQLIRVKAPWLGAMTPFFKPRNEAEVSGERQSDDHPDRISSFRKEPRLFTLA